MNPARVAYFSMEMMLESDIPTYAGGLGVLAGDLLRSAADMHIPVVGITLVYSGAIFGQVINPDGTQTFYQTHWQKLDQITKLPAQISLTLAGTQVKIGCWRYDIVGMDGFTVPVYLLDTDLVENSPWARELTRNLYDGRGEFRLCQEAILGLGGIKMLRVQGYKKIETYHLNEGHSTFAALALLEENDFSDEAVRKLCVFTTHTPVPEGHDKFAYDFAYHYLESYLPWHIRKIAGENELSMTHLGLNLSRYSFAVSRRHLQTTATLFPGYKLDFITNGVHHRSWTGPYFQDLYSRYLPGWLADPGLLSDAPDKIPDDALWAVHQESKHELISYVNTHLTSISSLHERLNPLPADMFDTDTLTISLARRPVAYKRPLLLYNDLEKLSHIGEGKIQIIQCGKSHPTDDVSQGFLRQIVDVSKKLRGVIKVVYLENYAHRIGRLLVSGSDLWLNTPMRPLEASGTSGMKAALNGCLNFSVLDGWWLEGFRGNPQSGFSIGPDDEGQNPVNDDTTDVADLYGKLGSEIIPMYYDHRSQWLSRMKQAITLGAYFNTHRCLSEYITKAWKLS